MNVLAQGLVELHQRIDGNVGVDAYVVVNAQDRVVVSQHPHFMSKPMTNAVVTGRNGDLVPFMDPVEHELYKRRVVLRIEIFPPSKAELADRHGLDVHLFTEGSRARTTNHKGLGASWRGVVSFTF
jgi:hypothetical protein